METRILIIDDHEAVRQALEERLRSVSDIDVVGCTGCWEDGLRLAARQHPDVVLLETKRADGQGLEALRRIRAGCPSACIVVLTSYPEPEEQQEAFQAGAMRYLLKDIGSDSLVQEIRSLVQLRAPI